MKHSKQLHLPSLRLRKPLKHAGLLQNYFEWSGNSNEMTTQFNINNEQVEGSGHHSSVVSCVRVGNIEQNHECCSLKKNELTDKDQITNYTVDNCNLNNIDKQNQRLNNNDDCNYNVILISEYFHLKLDVADFINSYNEMLTGVVNLPNKNI
ncbi:hypothetical protein ABK040_007089 [Willaertia magna]